MARRIRRSIAPVALRIGLTSVLALAAGVSRAVAVDRRPVTDSGAVDRAPARSVRGALDPLRDSALTTGTLPNGMRYYLRPNRMPAKRVELRLAVDAGSVLEDDDQQGFAHFLEHMAFNGTTHFPRQSLIDFVETSGMRFGADLNAYTSYDETVYMLTLPTDDRAIVGKGLDVLHDWASGGITIDSAEVVAERGVIMGEWRMRMPDSASKAARAHYDTVLYGGTRYVSRMPIGDTALLVRANPGPIRRFYRDWYRPDLMTVVVVGDFDRAWMEREVRARFGGIAASRKRRTRPAPALRSKDAQVIDVYRGRGIPSVEVLWPVPAVPAKARDAVRARLVQELLTQELDERLLAIRRRPSRPFITAKVEQGRIIRPLDVIGVELIAWPDSLERGLATVVAEIEQVARYGAPDRALAERKAVLLRRLEHEAASEAARSSGSYADRYVAHALTGGASLLSAAQELALARELLPAISPRTLAEAARFWRRAEGRRVLVRLPQFAHVRPPTEKRILALFDSVTRMPMPAPADSAGAASDGPLLAAAPAPGTIVRETQHAVSGIAEWTLSNGARVLFKPTQTNPDELLLRAWSPGGFSTMPDSLFFTPGRMVARVMTEVGGVGTMGRESLARRLATTGVRSMTVDIGFADESIDLRGSPRELELLFQLLHLQFTAPMLDSAALAGWQSLAKYRGTPFSLDDQFNQIFARGNPRLLPVGTQIAELTNVDELLKVYRNRFGNASDFTFTIVGAATPAEVRPFVERYLASLPGTGAHETPKSGDVAPFLMRVARTFPALDLPKAITLLVYDGLFPSTRDDYLRERQRLSALSIVLRDRLRTRLREELAGTYSPMVMGRMVALPEEHYRVLIGFDAAPERMRALNKELMRALDSLRTHGVTVAEAARAATIQRRQLETLLQDDEYWLAAIGEYTRLGVPLDEIPTPYGGHEATPAELQEAAKQYLPSDVYIHLTAMPRDSTLYTARSDSADSAP